jgi:hypothetical protein
MQPFGHLPDQAKARLKQDRSSAWRKHQLSSLSALMSLALSRFFWAKHRREAIQKVVPLVRPRRILFGLPLTS